MVLPSSTSARLAAYTAIAGAGAVAYMYATRSRSGAAVLSAARRYFPRPGRTVSIKMRAIPAGGAPQGKIKLSSSEYPPVRRDDSVVETLHGVEVADPYRWLEDPDAEETKQFVAAQNKVTDGVLAQCQNRAPFKKLLTRMMDYPKYGCPFKRGDRYYYFHNTGLQAQYVLYTQATLEGEARVLLDPNTLSTDGTVALGRQKFSDDGKLMAFELSTGGSDWKTVQVLRVEEDGSPTWLPDKLDHVKFSSLCFTMDGKGIFYNCYEPPSKDGVDLGTETDINLNQQLRYHQLGTPQEEDPVVYAIPEFPDNMIGAQTTDDGSYLLMTISSGCLPTNKLYYVDLRKLKRQEGTGVIDFAAYDFYKGAEKLPVVKLVDNFDASYDYVANDGAIFTFQTNLDAPRYRLVRTELSGESPASVAWEDLLAQHEQELLESAVPLAGELMVVEYLRDVRSVLQLRSLATAELVEELELPGLGAVQSFSGRRKDSEFFFSFTSLVEPGATYRVDVSSGRAETSLFRRVEIEGYSADDFVMEQLFVKSADGTSVPMFVAHRRGLPLDGSSPCHLYGYGGFNISLSPYFSCSRAAFMKGGLMRVRQVDGVYCSANLRGGGEYGVSWRDAGSLGNKQKVFDDFQACAEHLIESGYTSSNKLFINGGSNGGLLVAACVNQRPDLYAAAVAQVGVMDMLRFHKFTIGHAWTKDFGDPDDPEQFKFLLPYSPLHNVALPTNGQYPAMMLTTGDHDDRVVPLHSHKLIATLQYAAAQRGDGEGQQLNPLITRIDVKSGHGAGKPTQKVIEEVSDMYGFVTGVMGVKWALQD